MLALSYGDQLTVNSGVVTPTHNVHSINTTGTPTINTINILNPSFCGILVLLCESGEFGIGTSGNIGRSGAVNAGSSTILVYNPNNSKWHPVGF